MPLRKIWILAEPECFFLPFLVDLLAKRQVVAGIIEIHFKRTFMARLRSLFCMLDRTFADPRVKVHLYPVISFC